MWGLWGELPLPTLYHGFGEELARARPEVLRAHAASWRATTTRRSCAGRAQANRVLGSERVFGWGAAMRPEPVRRAA
jgi:hypothetical protein